MIYIILLMILLVALSAFFSGSEISYSSANRLRLQKAVENGSAQAAAAEKLLDSYDRLLSTVLVGNNLVNIAFSTCMTVLIELTAAAWSESVAPLLSTAVLLVFGETIPKIIASERSDDLVPRLAAPLRFFKILFYPVVVAVSALVRLLSRFWTPEETEPEVTDEELVSILETIEEEGVFTEQESELIRSAIEFSDVTALDIYVPRVDMQAYDLDDGLEGLLADPEALSYSRIPVYRGSIDNLVGILSTKKLLKAAVMQPVSEIAEEQLLSPVVYVHKTRNISSILAEFRAKHLMMAIVVDEFGGTMGLLTLEDILEEIVGDIFDESDDYETEISDSGSDVYTVDAGMNIYDFFEHVGYEPPDFESEYTTVGGWAIEVLDRFPQVGDTFEYDRFSVTVTEAEAMRVETLEIRLLPEQDEKDKEQTQKGESDHE